MMDSLVLLSRRRRHRRGGGDGGDKGETENEQLTTTMLLILSVESRKEKILKVPKHSYVLLARTPKVRNSKNPTQKHRYKALCFEHLSHSHSSWDLQTYGSLTRKTTPRADEHGTRSFWRWIPIFFSRKMMRPALFFLAAAKGFCAMEKRRGKRDGREGVGVDRDAEVRDAECFRLDFLFVPLVSSNAGGVDGGWSPFLRAFFSSFSLLAFGWTSR